jgi:hypothetical protein
MTPLPVRVIQARARVHDRLRSALVPGAWLSEEELVALAGLRYRARIDELRRGADGGAQFEVDRELRPHGRVARTFYRARAAA